MEAFARYPLYLYHSWITFYEMVVGFLLAAAVGVFLAVVIVYSRIIRNMIYPQIVVLQIVPKVAIAPLLSISAASCIRGGGRNFPKSGFRMRCRISSAA